MTYVKSGLQQSLDAHFNIYYDASVSSVANDQPVTYASEDTSFGRSFTLTKSGAQFTLPSDGSTYYLEASIVYWHVSYPSTNYNVAVTAWYDTTASAYVGVEAINTSGLNVSEGRSGDIVADETAKMVTAGGTYELRLKTTTGDLTAVDMPSGGGTEYIKARAIIWRF